MIVFAFLLLHGIIHLLGFAKAYHFGNVNQLTIDISKPVGLLWLLTSILFILSAILGFRQYEIPTS
jgi:hypothetical protein